MNPVNEYAEVEDIGKVKRFIMKALEGMVNDQRFEVIVKEASSSKSYKSDVESGKTELL